MQRTPDGDVAVVYLKADDLQAAFARLGSSQDPFDSWFRDVVREVHGIDLARGFPPPEHMLVTGAAVSPSSRRAESGSAAAGH